MVKCAFPVAGFCGTFLALGAVGLSFSETGPTQKGSSEAVAIVDSEHELIEKLQEARGPTKLLVRSGIYGNILIGDSARDGPLIIEAEDPIHPPIFDGITIAGAASVTLRGLRFERRAGARQSAQSILVRRARNVSLENIQINGAGEYDGERKFAIMVRESEQVRIVGAQVAGTRYGIQLLDSHNITIQRGELRDLQTDGIRGGGVDDLLIADNVIGRFHPAPSDHPDGIQLWTANQSTAAKRITIRDNLIVRDGPGITQGIFVRDNKLQIPFKDLQIQGNLVIGTLFNGISVQGADNLLLENNHVLAFTDQKSWIRIDSVLSPRLVNNRAMIFLLNGKRVAPPNGNRAMQAVPPASVSSYVRTWLDGKPGLRASAGPYLRELAGLNTP